MQKCENANKTNRIHILEVFCPLLCYSGFLNCPVSIRPDTRAGNRNVIIPNSCVYKRNVYEIHSFTYQLGLKTHKWMPEWIMEVIPSNSTKEINRYCFSYELFDFQCTFLSVKDDCCNQSSFSPHLESGDFRAGAPGCKGQVWTLQGMVPLWLCLASWLWTDNHDLTVFMVSFPSWGTCS